MKYVQAVFSLAVFGWFGYVLLTAGLTFEPGGSSKSRVLKQTISGAVETLGAENADYLCIAAGILLAAYFVVAGQE